MAEKAWLIVNIFICDFIISRRAEGGGGGVQYLLSRAFGAAAGDNNFKM